MRYGALALTAAAVAISVAAAAGVPEPPGYRLDDYRGPGADAVTGGRVVHTRELQALLQHDQALPIDVLPAPRRPEGMRPDQPWMPVPRQDIPGSLWLPDVGRGMLSPALDQWFQDRLAQATGGNKRRPLIFYCLSRCWMSWNATKRAAQYGYRRVYWYPDGSDGWEKAGLPLAEARPEPAPPMP